MTDTEDKPDLTSLDQSELNQVKRTAVVEFIHALEAEYGDIVDYVAKYAQEYNDKMARGEL